MAIVLVGELFGAESMSQVYGRIHTLLQENEKPAKDLGILFQMFLLSPIT